MIDPSIKKFNKSLLGTDLKLYNSNLGSDLNISSSGDLDIISEEMNLAQAIIHRIKTVEGELDDIGHPLYGSKIYDFIGKNNNEMVRLQLKNHIRNILLQELRIKKIIRLTVKSFQNDDAVFDTTTRSLKISQLLNGTNASNSNSNFESNFTNRDYQLMHTVQVEAIVLPINSDVPLQIAFPFYFDVMV